MSPDRKRPPRLKRYRVLCAVTRAEWYEIDAPDESTALRAAFCEGELVEIGDTTDATECDVEEVDRRLDARGRAAPCLPRGRNCALRQQQEEGDKT